MRKALELPLFSAVAKPFFTAPAAIKKSLCVLAALTLASASVAEPVRRVNYDEAKVPPYELEDPLVSTNGNRLVSAEEWPERRREMLSLIERELYGTWPPAPETLLIDKTGESETFYGLARMKQFSMYFRPDRSGPRMDWMLLEPAYPKGRSPVIVLLNYRGNHELMPDENVSAPDFWVPKRHTRGKTPNRVDASARGKIRYPLESVVARGYAVLTACYLQAATDPETVEMSVDECRKRGCYTLWKDTDVGTLAVWGWALSRGLDLAERQPELDATRAVAFGYSRLAKAALLAGAFDERFRVVIPCQTGGGGVPLQKRQFGENADWMTQVFPHWFCRAYMKYANNEKALPLDQHFILAAVAPRHLLIEGFNEPWYDTKGEWLACRAASPVWEFLGKPGLPGGDRFPDDFSMAAIGTHLGYVRRPGSHGLSAYDWQWALDFADRAFGIE
ncbi:MAG: hypothetical protein PHN85_09110 [Kiritimatiellae bacterium]|nr:hypothetical protein [Kiritimatiellia bacterium]